MIKFERHEDELIGVEHLIGDTYIFYVRKMGTAKEFRCANTLAQKLTERLDYDSYEVMPIKDNSAFYGADLYNHFSVTFKENIKKEFKF